MKQKPMVSVIMPAYNAAAFIAESIRSVQQQSHLEWELLVIDDASKDGTSEVVEALKEKDDRIKLHILPTNQGAGFARNIGIKAATGDFISFLDADDLWKPSKLEKQLKVMQEENMQVCFSSYELMNEDGQSLKKQIKALKTLSFDKLKKANYIGNLTGIYSARALGKIYCPLIRKRQDWGLWLLAVKKAGGARGIQEPLAIYRERKGSISQNKVEMLQYNYRVYRKVLKYSSIKSLFWMVLFLWEQLFVKQKQKVAL
ncbi:glycosyltransferase family 2 protein [Salinimicrobium sediminilitoris]|uniref:glycosyltransferase family 2 protein n=1 Tax=Salinimicrobium sediminilitoris TaxID=2876715 RepID=UPI001E51BB24|nr:glycosyltransferase family 2 protein [Salinimicrobium sediminilitoris]MCC8359555.1 glycosyltransferase [Salinimicrobium sediminilitoris]